MKVIKQILTTLFFGKNDFSFEEKVLLLSSLYAGILAFISIFLNIAMNLGIGTIIIVSFTSILSCSAFFLCRIYRKINLAKWLFSINALIFCNFYWITNYGSRGSAQYFLLIFYGVMIFIWNDTQIRLITILVIINIIILFLIEMLDPSVIPPYPSERSRIIDSYIGLIILIGFFAVIVVNAKNSYIKQYKMAQRSDMLKSAFLANMSHEIRTPLNAIMGFTKLFTTRELSKEKKEHYSQLITDNSKYLMQLLSDILDISLIESGQLKTTNATVDLASFFNKLFEIQNHTLKEIGKTEVQLILHIPSENKVIQSDEIRLEQIMSNLISNAIKFTSQGYIKFGYYLQEKELVLFVEDTGIGIKEEFQPEIFNRFVKNEDNRDINFVRGAGIGLSLTKELVNLLGGKIWFTSVYHEGSTFYLTLPQKSNLLE